MTLPAGVTTCLVYKKAPVSFGGASGGVEIEITPSVRLIHTETGVPLVDFIEAIAPAEGGVAQVMLPHTDQQGFQDSAGNAFTNWHYTARVRLKKQGNQPKHEPLFDFQIPAGQSEVDLSKVPHGVAGLPTSAPIVSVTSVGGLTGAVTAEQVAALVTPPIVPDLEYPGYYLVPANSSVTPDPDYPGFYTIGA